mgnify:CR=1 FL=1
MTTKTVTAYRFFQRSGESVRSIYGDLAWPIPTNGHPGKWVRHKGDVKCCLVGLHASRTIFGAFQNRQGDNLAVVDAMEIGDEQEDKFACASMRIVRLLRPRHVVALAGVAAIMSLPAFEVRYPNDGRPHTAILAVIEWIRTGKTASYVVDAHDAIAVVAANAYAASYDTAYDVSAAAIASAANTAYAASYDVAGSAAAASGFTAIYDAYYASYAAVHDDTAATSARTKFGERFEREAVRLLALPEDGLADALEEILP